MKTVLNIDAIKDGSIGLDKLSEDTQSQLEKINEIEGKQDKLISGNNIKTINGASILGEGDITISVGEEDLTEILDRVSENEKVTAHALNEFKESLDGIVDNMITDIPIATEDTIGGIKIGTALNHNSVMLGIDEGFAGIGFTEAFKKNTSELLDLNWGDQLNNNPINGIPLYMGTAFKLSNELQVSSISKPIIPLDLEYFSVNSMGLTINPNASFGGATKVTWDANSNMNDFKTPGVYEIYGERTVKTDNLPITNDGSGHSISARLTVVASTLQPNNTEICVTQFLQLSNRIGGEGTTYVRTYNENNNGMNGWSPWQKQMGMVETPINGDNETVGQNIFTGAAEKIGQGLNGMIDNGMYSGIYVNNISYTGSGNLYYLSAQPTFVETFVLIVINDYAASGKLGMQRHITQLKYAIDAITGQSSIKKRIGTGNDTISWGNWEDIGDSKTILWGESSNMNDYKTAGTYDIYGERRNLADNLPILNSNPGHSIAARLTVVDSSLRKTDGTLPTEICVTQFLMLSNRLGGEGNMYVRTYNQNNSPFTDGWAPWQKLQGIREGYIFTDLDGWDIANIHGAPSELGMNHMIDNGIYTGIYTDDNYFNGTPSFLETFTLIVINNYAVAEQNSRLKRTISQLKYAVDAITNQASVKQRTKTDGDDKWTDWAEISGGSNEVDVTDAVKAYGLPTLIQQGLAKPGTTYKVNCEDIDLSSLVLDNNNFITQHLIDESDNSKITLIIQVFQNEASSENNYQVYIDAYIYGGSTEYYKYIVKEINTPYETVTRTNKMSKDGNTGTKPIIKTEENNITLEPNVYYRRIGETSNLNVTLGPVVNPDILNEYFLEFSVTDNAQVTFPSDIRWANKEVPTFNEPDTIYQISIVNNLGAYVKF